MSKIITNRPTFGVNKGTEPSIDTTKREEIGAIWKTTTRANKNLYNVKINLTKSKLQEILASAEGEVISVSLVGFDNEYNQGDIKRPIIRMYEPRKD